MTDQAGAVVWKADYKPFGEAEILVETVENNFRYAGQYYDSESGLHYNYFRYYDPSTGRYNRADPIGQFGGVNLYSYAFNNPLYFIDFFGLASVGDVVFFNWSSRGTSTWPRHSAIVTAVDATGNPTHAFGGWGDTMTFHTVDLSTYNGGIQDNIIGTGDMTDLNSLSLQDFINDWTARAVAAGWNGDLGSVCIDAATATDGYGGQTLRTAMLNDYNAHPNTYIPIPLPGGGSINPNPNNDSFYRRNPWLQQFFINTNRYTSNR